MDATTIREAQELLRLCGLDHIDVDSLGDLEQVIASVAFTAVSLHASPADIENAKTTLRTLGNHQTNPLALAS